MAKYVETVVPVIKSSKIAAMSAAMAGCRLAHLSNRCACVSGRASVGLP